MNGKLCGLVAILWLVAGMAGEALAQSSEKAKTSDEVHVHVMIDSASPHANVVTKVFDSDEHDKKDRSYWEAFKEAWMKPARPHEIFEAHEAYLKVRRDWLGDKVSIAVEQFASLRTELIRAGMTAQAAEKLIAGMIRNLRKVRAKALVSLAISKSVEAALSYSVVTNLDEDSSRLADPSYSGVRLPTKKELSRPDRMPAPDAVIVDQLY